MMKRFSLIIVLGLLAVGSVGAAVYYRSSAVRWRTQATEALAMMQAQPTEAAPVVTGEDERVKALEQALAEREAELAELRAQEEPVTTAAASPESTERVAAAEPEPVNRRNRMEELRETDPERYAQIQEQRAAFRQRVQDSFARQTAHFLYRDRDQMSTEELEVYDYMLGLLGETWQLTDRMQDPDLERDERRDIGRRLFENARELRPLLEEQRDREFYDMAVQLGYDSDNAMQFVDYINEMIEVTSLTGPWMRRGGGRGRD